MTRVALVDYGAGNMYSISRALAHVGADVVPVAAGDEWDTDISHVVLPGVGAFGAGMAALESRGLSEPLIDHGRSGRPLLGICLGAQLLLERSLEFGETKGLGIIDGDVVPFAHAGVRVPHIGWGRIDAAQANGTHLLDGIDSGSWMYFVHSFHLEPSDPATVLTTTRLADYTFTSAVARGGVCGVQFHPEKSSFLGLRILQNFIDETP